MSCDWIKIRKNLSDDPDILRIAAATRLDEDAVVGKVIRFWSWADSQTADGRFSGITSAFVDKLVRKRGFAAALQLVGWLDTANGEISIPNFTRHNGHSAKARATDAQRKQNQRRVPILSAKCPENVPPTPGHFADTCRTRERERGRSDQDLAALAPRGASEREATRTLPAALDTPEFRTAWQAWLVHWSATYLRGSPMPHATADSHLRLLEPLGTARALAALANATTRGLREPAEPFSKSNDHHRPNPAASTRRPDLAGNYQAAGF